MKSKLLIAATLLSAMVLPAGALCGTVKNFPLKDVKLLDGEFKRSDSLNVEVLLKYDVDRLLAPYLKEAGLRPKGESYPNWDGLDGHVGGHYLSALAMAYASTGNQECKRLLGYMLDELEKCQKANGNGYVGGVPGSKDVWDRVKAGDGNAVSKRWVPWYNIHKTYAGLRDAWTIAGDERGKDMFLKFCDWGIDVISGLDDVQMEKMLDTEFGGMNEVYADAYEISGDKKYLDAAKRFSHKKIFDSMAKGVDNLDNMHANTQVPKAVGYQRVAELTGDADYTAAAGFFWETVTGKRSLSFGGNSRREHFPSAAGCREYTEEREGPETCNTYNMLKLTEGLFRMNPDAKYTDFYERALLNHIRSTQHPEHGGYVYFTSARPRHYRVYSAPGQGMWCCVGTGMENHGKYGEFIYAHSDNDLYVNLFIPSELTWEKKGLTLIQNTTFPEQESTKLTLKLKKPQTLTLKIRKPGWLDAEKPTVTLNGKPFTAFTVGKDSYVSINRKWKSGDVVEMKLPMKTYVEEMPNVADFISIIHGPVVLAARAGTEDLAGLVADHGRWSHIAHGKLLPLSAAPIVIGDRREVENKLRGMKPVAGKPMHFTVPGLFAQSEYEGLELEPFSALHDSRYMVYWQEMTAADYKENSEKLAAAERRDLELDRRTVDIVVCGEQQPEVDHRMKSDKSFKGVFKDKSYRSANDGGFVSFEMATGGNKNLTLNLRFWGDEKGECTFDILVDGTVVATENISGKWNKPEFVDSQYELSGQLLDGKEFVTLEFRPHTGNKLPGIYNIRLLKAN